MQTRPEALVQTINHSDERRRFPFCIRERQQNLNRVCQPG
jgi:hypothetical protein